MNFTPIKKKSTVSIPRFFLNTQTDSLKAGLMDIPKPIAHHMSVLRLKQGDKVHVFNGFTLPWQAVIVDLSHNKACLELQDQLIDGFETELPFSITVAQSMVESNKMDWIIEKSVELGIHCLYPIDANRSVIRLDTQRAAKRVLHWQAIAVSASEQCGRNRIMQINTPVSVDKALNQLNIPIQTHQSAISHLLLHPKSGVSLQDWCIKQTPHPIVLWIGPEGGWSETELNLLESMGCHRTTFGKRVLRTETAALAISAAIQALWT